MKILKGGVGRYNLPQIIMKKSFKFLLTAFTILAIIGCNGKQETNKIYKVGTTAEYPPFEYLDNGKIVGYDVDVIEEISKKTGIKYEWKDMNFDGLIAALQTKKIDIVIAGISSTPEREKVVNFSIPYHEAKTAFLMNKDNPMTMDNLEGKKFGVDLGTTNETTARSIKGANVVAFSSTGGTLIALKNKKVDCLIIDETVAEEYIKNNPELDVFGYGPGEGKSIAFNKDDEKLRDDFDKALEELEKDGTLKKLQEKYKI